MHKSGFVNIIGHPNVGKSTLLNQLMKEKMSIITHKPQTTRHRIFGIYNDDDHQIVFSDTPGLIKKPAYKMQESMNKFAHSSFEDADVLLFMTAPDDEYEEGERVLKMLAETSVPKFLVINKIDKSNQKEVEQLIKYWQSFYEFDMIFPISALENAGVEALFEELKKRLPEGPPFYPKDQISDKSERFFVSEIIRENILKQFKQEIPYSCEVEVESFKHVQTDRKKFVSIRAVIHVSRKSQKSILIGKQGSAIKRLGTESRKGIEKFLHEKVFLELFVKVKENWRDDESMLRSFGYEQ